MKPFDGLETLSISTQTDLSIHAPLTREEVTLVSNSFFGNHMTSFEITERLVMPMGLRLDIDGITKGERKWLINRKGESYLKLIRLLAKPSAKLQMHLDDSLHVVNQTEMAARAQIEKYTRALACRKRHLRNIGNMHNYVQKLKEKLRKEGVAALESFLVKGNDDQDDV